MSFRSQNSRPLNDKKHDGFAYNRAARIVVKSNRTENCFPSLKWLHLSTRGKVHRCILIYKILNCIAPTYLDNYFVKNVNIHNFNTIRKENFVLPRVNRELGKKTFRFQGAKDYKDYNIVVNIMKLDVNKIQEGECLAWVLSPVPTLAV